MFKYGESAVYSGDAAVSSRCKSVFDDNCKSKSIAYFCEKILQAPSSLTPWHTDTHEMDFVSCWVHRIQFIVPFIKCGKYKSICYTFFSWRIFFELPEKTPIKTAHGPTLRRGVGNTIFATRYLVRYYEIIVIINIFFIIVTIIIIIIVIIFCFQLG